MQQQQQQNANHTCDDLDCFFCEQIATHIEHKRSASNMDIDSPTRKRGRFYWKNHTAIAYKKKRQANDTSER